jgi:hypothetical protein
MGTKKELVLQLPWLVCKMEMDQGFRSEKNATVACQQPTKLRTAKIMILIWARQSMAAVLGCGWQGGVGSLFRFHRHVYNNRLLENHINMYVILSALVSTTFLSFAFFYIEEAMCVRA